MKKLLTNDDIQKLQHDPNRRTLVRDLGAPGLYLCIASSGHRVWTLCGRRPNGRQYMMTLGPVDLSGTSSGDPVLGTSMSLQAARILTNQLQRQRAQGFDIAVKASPSMEMASHKAAVTSLRKLFGGQTPALNPVFVGTGVVYFVAIGEAIKIGFTTNLDNRLKALQNASGTKIRLLALLPGSRKLEKKLHQKFHNERLEGEFFKSEAVMSFLYLLTGLSADDHPAARAAHYKLIASFAEPERQPARATR